jgi:hypothetical protein
MTTNVTENVEYVGIQCILVFDITLGLEFHRNMLVSKLYSWINDMYFTEL